SVEAIIAKDPASALYLPYAERLIEDGRLEEAIALCEQRKRRPGRGVGDHIVLGRAYLADGQIGPARAEFKDALDLEILGVRLLLEEQALLFGREGRPP